MRNTFGSRLTVTLFGESHGPAVGAVLDGLPPGMKVDQAYIESIMAHRKASGSVSTGRHETDEVEILSGVYQGYTQGTPLALLIRNEQARRQDYDALQGIARPSHADYAGFMRYEGYSDPSGGGHFSGRLTAPLTAAGAICMHMLEEKNIFIGTHIRRLKEIEDMPFDPIDPLAEIRLLADSAFPVLNPMAGEVMIKTIEQAAEMNDSLGGILETAVYGMKAGVGEPWFDSVEGMLSHALFSIPAVKGASFGAGFGFADLYGSQANDPFAVKEGKIVTLSNNSGGINGGITNGMPILFQTVVRPTPSITQNQKTINYQTKEETEITIDGRHDPAVLHRAAIVQTAVTAIVLCDLLLERLGSAWFTREKI